MLELLPSAASLYLLAELRVCEVGYRSTNLISLSPDRGDG